MKGDFFAEFWFLLSHSKRFSTAVGEVGYWLKGSEIFLTSHDKRIKITNFFLLKNKEVFTN